MGFAETLSALEAIHNDNFLSSVSDAPDKLAFIMSEHRFSVERPLPAWFDDVFAAVVARRAVDRTFFAEHLTSDLHSIFVDLQEDLLWNVDYYGESIRLKFPAYQVEAFIVDEGRCFYEVNVLMQQ